MYTMYLVYLVKIDEVKAVKPNIAKHLQACELGWIVGWIKNSPKRS